MSVAILVQATHSFILRNLASFIFVLITMSRETDVSYAKLALQADRYDEMIEYMERVAMLPVGLSPEEVNCFRFASPAADQMSF